MWKTEKENLTESGCLRWK